MIDYTEQNDHCYLVMEYIRGKSLGQYLNEEEYFFRRGDSVHCRYGAANFEISAFQKAGGLLRRFEAGQSDADGIRKALSG